MPSELEIEHRASQEENTERDETNEMDAELSEVSIIRSPQPASPSKGPRSRTGTCSKTISQNEIETQVCPLCGKTLATNNAGLNEHIDFCLSKEAIMRATQVTASKTARSSPAKRAKYS